MVRSNFFTTRSRFVLFCLLLTITTTASQTARAQHEHGEEADEHHDEDVVNLSEAELLEFQIEQAVAGSGVIDQIRTLPAEVRINENLLAHIVPRYDGIATAVNVNIGDTVAAGDVLAVVESNDSLAPYDVATSIAGTIVQKHMTRGEPVTRENSGFMIADLSSVWIDITVYQRDLELIRTGQQVTIAARDSYGSTHGILSYITPIVDPHTRTATARLVVDNTDGHWRPGMFVMAEILVESAAAEVVVPRTAVHTVGDETVVFVATAEGFEPRAVTIGRRGKLNLEITSGLVAGDRYVAVGGFTMKAELGKESFGGGHGH